MTARLAGKVALVTGGTSGIGYSIAQEFLEAGAKVAITGRNEDRLSQATQALTGVLAVQADVAQVSESAKAAGYVRERLGLIDILVVNAGITMPSAIGDVNEADFDAQMGINFKGAFFTIQKTLPSMNDGGSIILIGSGNAHAGFSQMSVYSASKAALHSLARTLGNELAPRRIRVNTLNVGPVETPLWGKLGLPEEIINGFSQQVLTKIAMKRFGQADEIAKAALFLASDESSFVTASELSVDGGMTANVL